MLVDYYTLFKVSSGICDFPSFKDAQWRKSIIASSSFKGFKWYGGEKFGGPNLGNWDLDVTKILYSGIWKRNFSTRDSDPGQTSSSTSRIGLGFSLFNHCSKSLTAPSWFTRAGTSYLFCLYSCCTT